MVILSIVTFVALFLLFYVYVGYPALITVLSRTHGNPVRKRSITPPVTLIIPAYNEARDIAAKIENVLALDYPKDKLQIIVADDGSQDATAEIARGYLDKGIDLLSDGQRRGKVRTMNRAVQRATGDIVVFSDANVMLAPESLKQVISNFADSTVGGVVAKKKVQTTDSSLSKSDGLYWRYEEHIQCSESRLHSTVAASGHMQAIRKTVLPEIPEDVLVLDDLYLAMSVMDRGLRAVYEPDATCWEGSSATMEGEVARRKRITASRYYTIEMMRKHFRHMRPMLMFQFFSHKILRLFIPVLMIVAFLGNLAMVIVGASAGTSSPLWVASCFLLAAQIVFYVAAVAGAGLERIGRKLPKLVYLPYFLCSTNMASLSGLMWYVTSTGNPMWQRVERE